MLAATPAAPGPDVARPARVDSAAPLRSPFDVERWRSSRALPPGVVRPDPGRTRRLEEGAALAPVVDVEGVSFYVDDARSIADPELERRNREALGPLRSFVRAVVGLADAWSTSEQFDPAMADPALAWSAIEALARWAEAGALLGAVNHQGAYEREWSLGSLALAYLKVRQAPVSSDRPDSRNSIQAWFRAIAARVEPDYERPGLKSSANNHAYFAGMALAAVGIASDDRRLFDWGIARARIGIAQIDAAGCLPLERERGRLALHYHVFALGPLVMLAEMALVNGIDLYVENGGALHRLASLVMEGLADPEELARRLEIGAQEIAGRRPLALGWAEPYHARFPDPRLGAWLRAARPVIDVRLGGDMTAAFARPDPEPVP
jgi:poly(beta-D-mannuronate) lyase